jgi:CTP:molybdopterin cytidylyltransferase MocA
MNRAIKNTNVLILAAGNSSRMQTLKSFLPFNEDSTFFEKIVNTYLTWGCKEIVAVINKHFFNKMPFDFQLPPGLKFILNEHPEFERFYSVKTGLQHMQDCDFCFIQNIDNPFITTDMLDLIYSNRSPEKYVIPTYKNKGGHPVLINSANMIRLKSYPEDNANLREVLGEMPSCKTEMDDDRILININTAVEFEKYFTLVQN